ncbi:hypothetical protein Tco_0595500, partial [Tanacetum coccineum]
SVNRIDVIDVSYEEYAQEVLGFSDSSTSGNLTPSLDPILSTSFPSLTPFEGGDFILEEIEACLTNDSILPGIDDVDFDPEGDLLLLEKLLNDDPSSPLPPKELHFEELKMIKSSIDDPPELKLKDLPSRLEYAFLEGTDKLPVIISKELKDEEKAALLKIEDFVPNSMWSQVPSVYDKHASWGISHWGRKRQQFYGFAVNKESARDVYSEHRNLAVTKLKIVEWHNYKHLNWITFRRNDDKLYTFKEGDYYRLCLQDIEDMLLLLVQGKLTNLNVEEHLAYVQQF